ncbi:MAG: hypothetical protein IT379_14865 [Deltaproteobacteria bacterium]|nr:hypothetical protein [Deltaproteobacteria bacterium]
MPGVVPYPIRDPRVSHAVLVLFGGDNNLSDQVYRDVGEMVAGNMGGVGVLALADFADRGAVVLELSARIGARVVESVGEINTGDPDMLATFLGRALRSYAHVPHVAIGFWDHGSGVFEEHDPESPRVRARARSVVRGAGARRLFRRDRAPVRGSSPAGGVAVRAMLNDDTNGGLLTTREAGAVLRRALAGSGRDRVDLVFSDTCLNGMVEVTHELAPSTDVVVGSQDLEPATGWDYALWFRRTSKLRPASGSEWAALAVQSYRDAYALRPADHPVTLSAFRTDRDVAPSFAGVVDALRGAEPEARDWVDRARRDGLSFARRDSYDLGDFAVRLRREAERRGNHRVVAASSAFLDAYDDARVAEIHLGSGVAGATGLALWIPSNRSELAVTGDTYRDLRWERDVGWWSYLAQPAQP